MRGVVSALAAQYREGRLVGALLGLTCSRLGQAAAKVLALAAAYAAGTLTLRPSRERPYRPRPETPPAAADAPAPKAVPAGREKLRLPTGFGWLLRRARVGFGRTQMAHLLAQPDMQALIAAVPPVAHHLRPVCRMLGVKPPPGLFPPRRPSRRPKPAKPAPDPAAAETPAPPKARKRREPFVWGPRPQPIPGVYIPPPPHLEKRWMPPGRRRRFNPV